MPAQYYKISTAANILGVSTSCLRRWDNEGRVTSWRSPGGHRFFDIASIRECDVANERSKHVDTTILYSRVSSSKQRDDLQRQQCYLREHYTDKCPGSSNVIEISDVASGLNFKRSGLLRVLGSIKEGCVSKVVVASRDRLARFGFELIEWLCGQYGAKVVVLNDDDSTPEEELGKDLMSIVQVYCCRWNGCRRYAKTQNAQVATETNTRTEEDVGGLVAQAEVHVQLSSRVDAETDKHAQGEHPDAKSTGRRKGLKNRKNE